LIRVLVEAKPAITRAGLEAVVHGDPRFALVGEGYRDGDLLHSLQKYSPEVLLLDAAAVPVSLQPALHQPGAPATVLLIANPVRAEIRRALQTGVRAILLREATPREILGALESAAAGLAVVSPEVLDSLLPASSELAGADDLPLGEPLTARESEILALLANGSGNKEIAGRLHISEHTVKFHVSSILAKLGAATRTEAVSRGYRVGLIVI
jgi:DNA-binding NarL/FixJ family response regulator